MFSLTRHAPSTAGGLTIAIAGTALAGWQLGRPALQQILPRTTPMSPTAAVALIALGLALFASAFAEAPAGRRLVPVWLSRACAAAAVVIGVLLFAGRAPIGGESLRSAALGASSIVLLGLSLALAPGASPARRRSAMTLALAGSLAPWISVLGYASRLGPFSAMAGAAHTGIPVVTALALLVLTFGVLGLWPEHGFAALITSSSEAGLLLRVLLPAALIVPVGIDWLVGLTVASGWFSPDFGAALGLTAASLVFAAFVLWIGLLFKRREADARAAADERERLLRELRASLAQLGVLQNGLVTICAWSKRVLDEGKWVAFEEFLDKRLHISVTHSISEESSDEELSKFLLEYRGRVTGRRPVDD